MPLITCNVGEQPSNITLAVHDAMQEPENPTLWGAGEEFANIETLNNAIAAMCSRIGNIAASFDRAEKKFWGVYAAQKLRQPCLNPLQRLAGIFNMPDAVARLFRNIKFGIESVANRKRAQIRTRNA